METTSLSRFFRQNVTSVCYIAQKTRTMHAWYIRSLIGGLDWGIRILLIGEIRHYFLAVRVPAGFSVISNY